MATSSFVESPRKRWRSPSGAVTRRHRSWLAACVLDFTAERRAVLKARIISTRPSALLGSPAVSPAYSPRERRSRRRVSRTCCSAMEVATLRPLDFRHLRIAAVFR